MLLFKSHFRLILCLAVLVSWLAGTLSTAAAQQPMKPIPISDEDWNYWSDPYALYPVDLDDWVGIGTASPRLQLEVEAPGSSGIRVSKEDANYCYGDIRPDFGTGLPGLVIDSKTGGTWADISFQTNDLARMFIESAGNVGIGTVSPARMLEIRNDAASAFLRLTGAGSLGARLELKTTDTTSPQSSLNFLNASDSVRASIEHYDLLYFDTQPGLRFNTTSQSGVVQNRMFIHDDTGNVGIGTDDPQGSLYADSLTLEIEGNAPSIVLDDNAGGAQDDFEISNGGAQVLLRDATDGVNIMSLGIAGTYANRVGIMTDTPKGTLDVNGSIYQRGSLLHADYVFQKGYTLESIKEHEDFMWKNKHLKAIPKAQVDENGYEIVEVGSHRRGIVEELEKAHIYITQLNDRIEALEASLAKMEAGGEREK